eukprot:SAG31_NODE_3582_length_4100_cov_3.424394_5_plen_50_part_00
MGSPEIVSMLAIHVIFLCIQNDDSLMYLLGGVQMGYLMRWKPAAGFSET